LLRIEARLLDDLIDQVGELTMAKAALLHESRTIGAGPLRDAVHRLEALVSHLQGQALQLRMMPLGLIADRFPRAVRDLAKQRGKEVQFEVSGADIELDRAILELLPDPILHILRNAVDHGIEPPDLRRSRGKPAAGRVRLEAAREREGVVLRIADDGRGMDPAALRAKGIALGLLRPEQAEALTDEEALLLVTLPGFSTAEEVSDVSGRGVGMDVVRSTIEALRGSLHIASVVGQGTAITLRLPLTLAIIDVLLVGVGEERYALPIAQILQTIEFSERHIQRAQGQELIPWGPELIPLVRLRAALGAPAPGGDGGGPAPAAREAGGLAVVAEVRGRPVGMAVDRLFGYDDVVVKPLGKALRGVRGFAGVTILGDGEMVLILDPNTL
jgi:two-component system chemotaxis sensor kinase CheA